VLRRRSLHIRLCDTPLASDTLVNQRLAVGGESGNLEFDTGDDSGNLRRFRIEVATISHCSAIGGRGISIRQYLVELRFDCCTDGIASFLANERNPLLLTR
jgi:hypothetical protein